MDKKKRVGEKISGGRNLEGNWTGKNWREKWKKEEEN